MSTKLKETDINMIPADSFTGKKVIDPGGHCIWQGQAYSH